jgi:phospholipid/cholesterol/gamma-HCH transport system substrate-binding protein
MRRYSDAGILRLGLVTMVVLMLVMAAAFNLQKFPGFSGDGYEAVFSDASGLHPGNIVQVAGIQVGRVDSIDLDGNRVLVHFSVNHDVHFGTRTRASIDVLNLLGEKYLDLSPEGPGQQSGDQPIPRTRTDSGYDIVHVFSDLATTTQHINTKRLGTALDTLSKTVDASKPEIRASFTGLSRLSQTVSSRDTQLQSLLRRSHAVSRLLAARKGDITTLVRQGDQLFRELRARHEAIHTLLVNTARLGHELSGLVRDNQAQIGPALRNVHEVLGVLQKKQQQLKASLRALGPYVSILGNIIGTGPWFDAYVVNLEGIGTGEFVPGVRGQH